MKTPRYVDIESTLDIEIDSRTVRLWINEETLESYYQNNPSTAERIVKFCNESMRTDKDIIEFVAEKIPSCNAVQVKDRHGSVQGGVVVYLVEF